MNSYPYYPLREVTDLDGIWDFHFIKDDAAPSLEDFSPEGVAYDTIETVPGVFDATLPLAGQRGLGVYRRTFTLALDGPDRIAVAFEHCVAGGYISRGVACDRKRGV